MLKNRPPGRLFRQFWRVSRPVALLFFLFFVGPQIFGGGQREVSLSRADELIAEKQYDQAIDILTDFMRKNPEKAPEAQARIQSIMGFRDKYNRTAEELLDTLENDPGNNERILFLCDLLRELDPARIAQTEDFINRIQEIALFRSNQRQLNEILAEGSRLLAQGNYVDSLRVYLRGLDLYQQEFFAAGYGADVETRVRQSITDLNGSTATLSSLVSLLTDAINAMEGQRNQGIEQANLSTYRTLYVRVGTELDRLTALRGSYNQTETYYREQMNVIRRTNPEVGDRVFLSFAARLFEGRPDDPQDGMIGLLDTLWGNSVSRLEGLLAAKLDTVYQSVYTRASNGDYAPIAGRADLLSGYVTIPLDLVERGGRYNPASPRESLFTEQVLSQMAGSFLKYRSMRAGTEYLRDAGALGVRYNSVATSDSVAAWGNGGDAEQLIRLEQANSLSFRQLSTETQALYQTIQGDIRTSSPYQDRSPEMMVYLNNASATVANLMQGITKSETEAVTKRYTIAAGVVEERLTQHEQTLVEAQALLRGEAVDGSFISKHPSDALVLLNQVNTGIDTDIQSLQTLLTQFAGEDRVVLENGDVASLRTSAQAMRGRFDLTRTQGRTMQTTANSQVVQAQSLRRDGERFLTESQAALNSENFDTARERLARAETSYNASLAIEDSTALRQERDNTLRELDLLISSRENAMVIRTVSELLVTANTEYLNGNLEQAEEQLTRAQNMWRRTQTVENQGVTDLLSLIRVARSLRSGRTIPPTAPLYAEMSQLLSEARRNYEEGRPLINTRSDAEGRARFSAAKVSTQKVRLMYPFNEEAGLLDLRIDRELDPAGFDAIFPQRVNAAIAGTRRKDTQAYADLLNLFAINPQYPNRAAIQYQAEIDIGYRPPPPTQEQIAQSNQLTAQARNVIRNRVDSQYNTARTWLNQAIALNPDNQAAKDLSNELAGTLVATTVFDAETDRKYNQALVYFSQNNYLQSYQLAVEIARDPRYAQNTKITDLLRRLRERMQ
jgi:chaperonin cofactor prefoldin